MTPRKTIRSRMSYFLRMIVVTTLLYSTLIPPQSLAQVGTLVSESMLNLPIPGTMVRPTDGFIPPTLKGLKIHPEDPLRFDFIVDTGNSRMDGEELKAEGQKLIKYFLASLTVPNDEIWVNLSPYEKDRIIPEKFGTTEMGRDLLAQDYVLKQLTASLIFPEEDLGKSFWDKVYKKAYDLYGTTNIPINTFNKVWIVPDHAVVYETVEGAFVGENHLKVMLEGDYLALSNNLNKEDIGTDKLKDDDVKQLSDVSSQIVREVILPAIEKEVNEGRNFAQLRQIYQSLILATWYKQNLKKTFLGQVYVDKNKIVGVDVEDKMAKQKIYEQYVEAFKKGVYDYIKDDNDAYLNKTIKRRYVSGGFIHNPKAVEVRKISQQVWSLLKKPIMGLAMLFSVSLVEPAFGQNQSLLQAPLPIVASPIVSPQQSQENNTSVIQQREMGGPQFNDETSDGETQQASYPQEAKRLTIDIAIDSTVTRVMDAIPYFQWRVLGSTDNLKTINFLTQNLSPFYTLAEGPIKKVSEPTVFQRKISEYDVPYIAAVLPGSLKEGSRNIVVTAHLDAIAAGADDNASGISALLSLARVMGNYSFKDNIFFVFTNDEEFGKLGARVLLKDLQDLGISAENAAFINIDTIGQSHLKIFGFIQKLFRKPEIWISTSFIDSDTTDRVKSNLLNSEVLPALFSMAPFSLRSDTNYVSLDMLPSDESVFKLYGYPAITISGISFADAFTTGILHTAQDTPEKISVSDLEKTIQWLVQALGKIGRSENVISISDKVSYVPFRSAFQDIERNYLFDTKELFRQYGLSFESTHQIRGEEYNTLSRWLKFLEKNFPAYKGYLKGIKYDLTLRKSHADLNNKIIEFGFPIASKAIWFPYGYLSKYGVWYASSEVVLAHEFGHFASEFGLRRNGINLYRPGEIGDLHSAEELFATDFALWFLYRGLKEAPNIFIDSYLHGTYDEEKGLETTMMSVPRNIIPFESLREELIEKAAKAIGISFKETYPIEFLDISKDMPGYSPDGNSTQKENKDNKLRDKKGEFNIKNNWGVGIQLQTQVEKRGDIRQELSNVMQQHNINLKLIPTLEEWKNLLKQRFEFWGKESVRIAFTATETSVSSVGGQIIMLNQGYIFFYAPFMQLSPLAHEIAHARLGQLLWGTDKEKLVEELGKIIQKEDKNLYASYTAILQSLEQDERGSSDEEILAWIYGVAVDSTWHYPEGYTSEEQEWIKERANEVRVIESNVRSFVNLLSQTPKTRQWLNRLYQELNLPIPETMVVSELGNISEWPVLEEVLVVRKLIGSLGSQSSFETILMAKQKLKELGDKVAIAALTQSLRSYPEDTQLRHNAVEVLGEIGDEGTYRVLLEQIHNDTHYIVAVAAAKAALKIVPQNIEEVFSVLSQRIEKADLSNVFHGRWAAFFKFAHDLDVNSSEQPRVLYEKFYNSLESALAKKISGIDKIAMEGGNLDEVGIRRPFTNLDDVKLWINRNYGLGFQYYPKPEAMPEKLPPAFVLKISNGKIYLTYYTNEVIQRFSGDEAVDRELRSIGFIGGSGILGITKGNDSFFYSVFNSTWGHSHPTHKEPFQPSEEAPFVGDPAYNDRGSYETELKRRENIQQKRIQQEDNSKKWQEGNNNQYQPSTIQEDTSVINIKNILFKEYNFEENEISLFINTLKDPPPVPLSHDERVRAILKSLGQSDELPHPLEYLKNSKVKSNYEMLKNILPSRVKALFISAQFRDYSVDQVVAIANYMNLRSEGADQYDLTDVENYILKDSRVVKNLNNQRFLDFYQTFLKKFNSGINRIGLLPVAGALFDTISSEPGREQLLFSESFQKTIDFVKSHFDFPWGTSDAPRYTLAFHLFPLAETAVYFEKNGFDGMKNLIKEIHRKYSGTEGLIFHNDIPLLIEVLNGGKIEIAGRGSVTLRQLLNDRDFLINYIKTKIYPRRPVFRSEGKTVDYVESPLRFEGIPTLFLLRTVLIDQALKDQSFLKELGQWIHKDRKDTTTEYGGFLEITEDGKISINNVRSISPRDNSYDPYLSLAFRGSLSHYHFHVSPEMKQSSGPSGYLADLGVADMEKRTDVVFTVVGDTTLEKKSEFFKINADIYIAIGEEGPSDQIYKLRKEDIFVIDLGEFMIPKLEEADFNSPQKKEQKERGGPRVNDEEIYDGASIENTEETNIQTTTDPTDREDEKFYGGIDLNPTKLNLQIRRDGQGIPLPLDQQPPTLNIDGLMPFIINVIPISVNQLPFILGMDNCQDDTTGGDKQNCPDVSLDQSPAVKESEYELVTMP